MGGTAAIRVPQRVLVVDDVNLNRMLAQAFLSKLGCEIFEADGGLAALQWLANNPPVDLLMLDISMPDLNGEEVCRQLRANPSFFGLKIVAYTAHASAEDSVRFLANGFDAVLIKPISRQRLQDVLCQLF
ncbi:MAG: response regulator [Comamonadaceae bacterium]|nr:response regulator [Comamonadaceae bacterium]